MPEANRIIRIVDGAPRVVDDTWLGVDTAAALEAVAASAGAAGGDGHTGRGLLLPLALALAQGERLATLGRVGVSLAPTDDPAAALPLFGAIALIGVQFPKFTDGRGYSSAVLLRTRLGWRGELRALGDVLQDQLFALRRVGFDSFALRADRDPQTALQAFGTFTGVYQGSVEPPLPPYARRAPAP
jgi:uncharacterized protein (DUF934 family)